MGNHNILSKVDRALVAWVISRQVGTADNVWPGKRSLDKVAMGISCWSHSFVTMREGPYSGTLMVESYVEVKSPGVIEAGQGDTDPRLASDALVSACFDCFFLGDGFSGEQLGEAITETARASGDADLRDAFTIINVQVVGGNQGFNPRTVLMQGNLWVDPLHLEIICCPSNVS